MCLLQDLEFDGVLVLHLRSAMREVHIEILAEEGASILRPSRRLSVEVLNLCSSVIDLQISFGVFL